MVWQDVFPNSSPKIDAEEDRELRLAAQARAGAGWALAALVARYQPPVTRYLTRLTGNPDLARVLAERIFVRMERRLHGPQGGQYLRLWLLRACSETGLEALRKPRRARTLQLASPPQPAGLLSGRGEAKPAERLRAGLSALLGITGQSSRQVRKLIWSALPQSPVRRSTGNALSEEQDDPLAAQEEDDASFDEVLDQQDPREALRYRMVRAVLAELPYGDAQCLALHLVAGLNQAEVAIALGLTNSSTRRRIVQGLQLFAQRYSAALASLGLPPEALATVAPSSQRDPLAPSVAGYVPIQEQSTVVFGAPQQPALAADSSAPSNAEAALFASDVHYARPEPMDQSTMPIIVDATPASLTQPPQEDWDLSKAPLAEQDWSAAPAGEDDDTLTQWGWSTEADQEWPAEQVGGSSEEPELQPWDDLLPYAAEADGEGEGELLDVVAAEPASGELTKGEPEISDVVDAMPEMEDVTSPGAVGTLPGESAAETLPLSARLVSVLTPSLAPPSDRDGMDSVDSVDDMGDAASESPQARVVPVLTPRVARDPVKTVPRPRNMWNIGRAMDATGQKGERFSWDEQPPMEAVGQPSTPAPASVPAGETELADDPGAV